MRKRLVIILNVIVLIILVGFLIYIVGIFGVEEAQGPVEEQCVEVNKVVSFVYEACYDAYSKNILLEVRRGQDLYNLKNFKFSSISNNAYEDLDIKSIQAKKNVRKYLLLIIFIVDQK